MLFVALVLVFILIAATRPGRARYRRKTSARRLHHFADRAPDPTSGLRDPARPF